MNCEAARLLIGSDPERLPAELTQHLASCAACSRYRDEMLALERDVRRALSLPAPLRASDPQRSPARPATVAPLKSVRRLPRFAAQSRWALAASVALVAATALLLFTARPADTLARDVVDHVAHEPESWSTQSAVAASRLDGILQRAGVARSGEEVAVTYAQSCQFRGGLVPHLVVHTAQGPYTVMVLRGTHIAARRYFNEDGYSGVLLPADGGTFAVLGRGAVSADAAAAAVSRTLHFIPQG